MADTTTTPPGKQHWANEFLGWVNARFPLTELWETQWGKYVAPKNFNFWYYFGSLAAFILVIQIVTGIFLTMNYKPDANLAFASVEYIMREVPWGWLIRYLHSTGASAFFIVVYLHMFRALLYGSYRKPRELTWIFGCLIFLSLMAEAFFGYLLPWGQMSFWGAQVIVNLFAALPVIGPDLAIWIRGDFVVGDATLNRFFAFHVIAVPLVLIGLVAAHLMALHETGSNNPDGVEIKKQPKDPATGLPLDGINSHPYYTVKDIFGVTVFLFVFSAITFFALGRVRIPIALTMVDGLARLAGNPGTRPESEARETRRGRESGKGTLLRAAFVVETVQVKVSTKNQKKFAILTISDGMERFELPVWSEMYEEKGPLLRENQLLYGILQMERKEGTIQLSCRYLDDLTAVDEVRIKACDETYDRLKAAAKAPEPKWKSAAKEKSAEKEETINLKLSLDADQVRLSHILALKDFFRSHPGKSTVELHFFAGPKRVGTVFVDSQWGVKADRPFQEKLRALTESIASPKL
jgi:quinol-cytochrome oxidoreductase complex cytochrome b subunit